MFFFFYGETDLLRIPHSWIWTVFLRFARKWKNFIQRSHEISEVHIFKKGKAKNLVLRKSNSMKFSILRIPREKFPFWDGIVFPTEIDHRWWYSETPHTNCISFFLMKWAPNTKFFESKYSLKENFPNKSSKKNFSKESPKSCQKTSIFFSKRE